jgi:hypothetical protein
MTNAQIKILDYVKWFKEKNGKPPTVTEIAIYTKKTETSVVLTLRSLNIYTEEQLITDFQRSVRDLYLEGFNTVEIAIAIDSHSSNVCRVLKDLKNRGLIKLRNEDVKLSSERAEPKRKVVYIEVIDGPFEGWRGYIDIPGKQMDYCRIYNGRCKEAAIWIENDKIEHIEGRM